MATLPHQSTKAVKAFLDQHSAHLLTNKHITDEAIESWFVLWGANYPTVQLSDLKHNIRATLEASK